MTSMSLDEATRADLRAAYQSVTNLIAYEGQLAWRCTAVFFPFATLLLAGAVSPSWVQSRDSQVIAVIATVFSAIGVTASIMWWSMVSRSRRYYEYWLGTACLIESQMGESVITYETARRMADGNSVVVGDRSYQFKTLERIRMRTNINLLYATFCIAFVGLICFNFVRLVRAF
jgi:hypothetical protein